MSEEYEIVKRVLNNIRSIRAFSRDCDYEWLEEVLEKLSTVVAERNEEYQQSLKAQEELEAKRKEAIALLANMGLVPTDLIDGAAPVKTKKAKRSSKEPKYIYTDESGNEKTWAGVGRTPKAIQTEIDSGRKIEEFLIIND